MPTDVLMPALSPTMTEGNLVKWHVKEGDAVKSGDVLAEIETDKATMEVEAVDDGTVGKILVAEGTEGVAVNTPILQLVGDGETASAEAPKKEAPKAEAPKAAPAESAPEPKAEPAKASSGKPADATPLAARMAAQAGLDLGGIAGTGPNGRITKDDVEGALGTKLAVPAEKPAAAAPQRAVASGERVFASPLARRIAAEAGVTLQGIEGSGPNGRIIRSDVEAAIERGPAEVPAPAAAPAAAPAPATAKPAAAAPQAPASPALAGLPEYELVPHSGMRKVIARRLVESKTTIPHFYLTVDCEIDELMALRKQLNARAPEGVKLSVNDFVIKAFARAFRKVPDANAAWTDQGMLRFKSVDVSVAVAIPGGLVTPVIRNADEKSLSAISAEMADFAKRARAGKLKPEEYQGGTTSISNLGMYGIKHFEAVINPPQASILAVGAGEPRPVVKGGQLTVATVMSCTLSCDHRVIDGATGAELLGAARSLIEYPAAMLL